MDLENYKNCENDNHMDHKHEHLNQRSHRNHENHRNHRNHRNHKNHKNHTYTNQNISHGESRYNNRTQCRPSKSMENFRRIHDHNYSQEDYKDYEFVEQNTNEIDVHRTRKFKKANKLNRIEPIEPAAKHLESSKSTKIPHNEQRVMHHPSRLDRIKRIEARARNHKRAHWSGYYIRVGRGSEPETGLAKALGINKRRLAYKLIRQFT